VVGLSENIEVRSIIGRFLEHTRVYAFENAGDWEVYAASADLMSRNMFRRVETCFPIEHKKSHDRVMKDLAGYLKDNTQAWLLQSDGAYVQVKPEQDEEPYLIQTELLQSFQ
jgi:polyphosphate kinase